MSNWQLQTAKAKLSELLRAVRDEGPQTITVRGKEEYVVMRKADEQTESRTKQQAKTPKTLWELFEPLRQSGVGDDLAESIEAGYRELPGGVRQDGAKFDRDE
jgi:prevent-host-death family protein